jgi:hypothetical protein
MEHAQRFNNVILLAKPTRWWVEFCEKYEYVTSCNYIITYVIVYGLNLVIFLVVGFHKIIMVWS